MTKRELTQLKRANTREMNQLTEHLIDLREAESKGWKLYLGDPLFLQLIRTERELENCHIRARKYEQVSEQIQSPSYQFDISLSSFYLRLQP